MHETADDIAWLQALLDRTLACANPHLASIVAPERRLTAAQVVRYLQGVKHVAFATVDERGRRVSRRSSRGIPASTRSSRSDGDLQVESVPLG